MNGQAPADLEHQLEECRRELAEAREQQTATSEVLKVISRSTFDVQAVLNTLVESAARLCEAENVQIFLRDGEVYRLAAHNGFSPEYQDYVRQHPIPPGRGTLVARTALEVAPVHIPDALADPEYTWHEGRQLGGYRTMLGIPLLRDASCVGVMAMTRSSVKPFTAKQIELVTTFADQAVIAIENVRLFDEVQARSRELSESLEQQTATSDVLTVIRSSKFELQPVLDTLIESAVSLCQAEKGAIFLRDQEIYRVAARYNMSQEFQDYYDKHPVLLDRGTTTGRAAVEGKVVHIPDVMADPDFTRYEAQRIGNYRSALSVPLIRNGSPIGVISIGRA